MHYSNQGRFQQQVSFLRRQFLLDRDLPFSNVLSEQVVAQALTAIDVMDAAMHFGNLAIL